MKITGIIAECNPFHEGHKYLIRKSKEITGADYTVVLLSGDFVQRGAPAAEPKEKRTRDLLEGGADAVLELPVLYSTAGAEIFAEGAVQILDRLSCITDLCFGSESGDIEYLEKNAEFLLNESEEFKAALRKNLKDGDSFPAARDAAACETAGISLARTPNDLLATEYLINLSRANAERQNRIIPHAILRTAAESASSIRERMLKTDPYAIGTEDFSEMLFYRLMLIQRLEKTMPGIDRLEDYVDVSEDLAQSMRDKAAGYTGFESFTEALKSRNLTYTRIARALIHILLGIRKSELAAFRTPGYVRVLGVRSDSADSLLAELSRGRIPVLTALAKDQEKLTAHYDRMLAMDVFASQLYDGVLAIKKGERNPDLCEFRKKLIKV
ncbi:MAG: nucleotidyltransferase family protein [Lachnospiraceae bacterium]|nr:nucleotidyltransferase family protein [Lachnospiraceae bacterium]MCH4029507.1 nucleotidyltransferase family protein [Lachnospiraceae bacterium]MCH4067642.1 nucleotidyltransferase family protein [Lachnospiraceae bacterium]MCH4113665.1 nucleotidyltransferase family protein [Lachnospiraceae bacterium]MCI1353748.1 nucleotidyltransferase family protein [Lachnospiraceae bacterium]